MEHEVSAHHVAPVSQTGGMGAVCGQQTQTGALNGIAGQDEYTALLYFFFPLGPNVFHALDPGSRGIRLQTVHKAVGPELTVACEQRVPDCGDRCTALGVDCTAHEVTKPAVGTGRSPLIGHGVDGGRGGVRVVSQASGTIGEQPPAVAFYRCSGQGQNR